ncbi:nucleotidyltransferase family protein [Candidatus Wolfebacteria bacterium]|nr:nucleotidyltransferase family protein [Candidatus Wolfebacteria bacterium]
MEKRDIIKKLNEFLPIIKDKYHIKNMGVFGSYIRDEADESSDLDILVEFDDPIGLLQFIELENYLSDFIGIKVDLVSKKALKPRIGSYILKEVVNI